ncbi:hypothetical protein GKZ90_0005610 [Flavobacterium sp. MC2016-06]|jgi:hypothetical protein|uniref:hypothetical protein n=1 Tax=Flavobacterium sp. MC2016-06 TaxID=2676308 RepID=UPI0012BADDFC|nr:hypothetical protein [Flavobacterium sp. MC2016-06]MBU3857614.1 hypothetical protein [Flavobacterium sp. MC2016-06]
MIVFNIYTTFHFDNLKAANDFIAFIIKNEFPLFENYGTSEDGNKKIEKSNFKAIARILSDYPMHAFGEIYFRTKNKKIILKIENNVLGISRWVLFVSENKFENSTQLSPIFHFLEQIINKYDIFFIGGDTQEEFDKLNSREEINSNGKPTILKVGFDNINQLPGIYWFNFLTNKLIPKNILSNKIMSSVITKTIKDGVFIVLTENIFNDNKRNRANTIIQEFPENLFFDKNKKMYLDWSLEAITDPGKIKEYKYVLLPYFDLYNHKETNNINWSIYNDKSIDEIKNFVDNEVLISFKNQTKFEDICKSIPLIIAKKPALKNNLEKLTISLGVLIGDAFIEEYNCSWSTKKGLFNCSIIVPNLVPKGFSPFFFVLQIIVNDLLPEDFINELKYYIK